MTVYSGAIDNYTVNVLSPKGYHSRRLMNLKGSFGVAMLWFYPEDTPLPDNEKWSGKNVFVVHYPASYWPVIVDVLRNESPVFFTYSDGGNSAQIYTGNEPVGEGEAI